MLRLFYTSDVSECPRRVQTFTCWPSFHRELFYTYFAKLYYRCYPQILIVSVHWSSEYLITFEKIFNILEGQAPSKSFSVIIPPFEDSDLLHKTKVFHLLPLPIFGVESHSVAVFTKFRGVYSSVVSLLPAS